MRSRRSNLTLLILSLLFTSLAAAKSDDRALAIQAAQRAATKCSKCLFFAVRAESDLIKAHRLFFVSTLNLLPPPYWSVAVSKKGKTLVLSYKNVADWNSMASQEQWKLGTDGQWWAFAKDFLNLAVGRALFIEKLNPTESARIQKAIQKVPPQEGKIVKNADRVGLTFYAKDVGGALQQWNLVVSPAGQILKADVRDF